MNRDFKFRVWDTGIEKMTYTNFSLTHVGAISFYWQKDTFHSARSVLMQFTGLRNDINGKEPYEGDIIKYYLDSGIEGDDTQTEYIEAIEWVGCGFELDGVPLTLLEDWPFEIIGNIYESPQFLK